MKFTKRWPFTSRKVMELVILLPSFLSLDDSTTKLLEL